MPLAAETRRQKFSSLALAAAACVVGLLLGELGLRLMGFTYVSFYYPDPVLGWVFRAGAQGTHTQEGNAAVKINRYGFRDHEWEVEKPAGHFRVAVLGDSYVAAMQVPAERRFTSVLEAELGHCGALAGRRPEVLDFGVGGWGTGQELLCLRDRVWQFDPDFIVLAFFHGNDVGNNSNELGPTELQPYFSLREGTLVLDDSFRNHPRFRRESSWWMQLLRSAVACSRTAQLLARAMDVRTQQNQRGARGWRSDRGAAVEHDATAAPQQERGLPPQVYFEPNTPAWERAWLLTEALLVETAAEARRHDTAFSLLLVTSSNQVRPGSAEAAHAMGLEDLLYPNRRLVELGRRHGFPVLSLAESLLAKAVSDGSELHGFEGTAGGHWNTLGHRAAGELLATEVCGQLDRSEASLDSCGAGCSAGAPEPADDRLGVAGSGQHD